MEEGLVRLNCKACGTVREYPQIPEKLCINCEHFDLLVANRDGEAEAGCAKGHYPIQSKPTTFIVSHEIDLRKIIFKGKDCSDFKLADDVDKILKGET